MGDIISQITTNWDFDDAKSLAEANLTAASADDKGDVFILAPNDGTARAIADAFGADTDVDSFVVTGQDAEIASVQYIIDGKQSMTVLKDVRNLVDDAISVAVSVVEGETVATTGEYDNGVTMVPAIQSEVITVDRSNVIEAIIESGYWDASEFTGLDQLGEVEEEEEEAGIDLEICGTDEEVTITYVGDPVDTSKAAELATIERFNEYCPNITVNRIDGDPSTTDLLASYFTVFEAESSDLDVIRVDVVNPGVLAEHLLDLNPYTPDAQKASYIPSLLVNNTVDGRLVALPIRLGFGMLYYRTDLLEKYGFDAPPATWDELETMAQTIQDGERAEGNTDFWGYVWQGNAYEGLTCNALEWQVSNGGGQIVNPDGVIEVNNEAAIAAFERAASWVGTISPDAVTSFQESDSNDVWMAGNAAFMRYWPGAYATSQQADAIKDVFATAPLPAGDSGEGASTMGGWEIGVSRYSAYPEAAAAFAVFMTGEENAKYYAIDTTFPPVILDLYNDPDIQAAVPYASPEIVEIVTPRPSTVTAEKYSEVSSLYWTAVHSILTGEQDAATAMELLELDLEALLQE
jgi:trehalose/maltose transport system substrate-binding protein